MGILKMENFTVSVGGNLKMETLTVPVGGFG